MEALHSLSCRAGRASLFFTAFHAKGRVAAIRLRPAGAIPAKTAS